MPDKDSERRVGAERTGYTKRSSVANRGIKGSREREYLHKHVTIEERERWRYRERRREFSTPEERENK